MNMFPKELESRLPVRFQDCDPFGHLNNARYIDYFLNAREDQLAQYYKFRVFDTFQQTKQSWVVTKTQIAYIAPAKMMEEVLIHTRLIHMDESTLVVEGVMLDGEAKQMKAVAWVEFTYISTVTGRRTTHEEGLMEFFRKVVLEGVYEAQDFSQRVEDLKRHGYQRLETEEVLA